MKAGTETGSLVNHLYSRAVVGAPQPEVGMGATLLRWTDREAATVTDVCHLATSKTHDLRITVREDDYQVTGGSTHDGSAKFAFTPRPEGYAYHFRRLRKTGQWQEVIRNQDTGRWLKADMGLLVGYREKYVDPSF